jgi:hypothetical protein
MVGKDLSNELSGGFGTTLIPSVLLKLDYGHDYRKLSRCYHIFEIFEFPAF